ncbi:hypothetical protein ACLOJK_033359 [Asimina triloba]
MTKPPGRPREPKTAHQAAEVTQPFVLPESTFSFVAGTVCGIYLAQNYNVPNINKLAKTALFMAKNVEESYRKPKKKDED